MDKKVIKSLFANIVGHDDLRPVMAGVHFEKEESYASDGHVFVIYNKGSEELAGKTMDQFGTVIEGRYPNVHSVIPKNVKKHNVQVDFTQLSKACDWHLRQEGNNIEDIVVIDNSGFKIKLLSKLLSVFNAAGELKKCSLFESEPDKARVLKSDSLTSIIMPCLIEQEKIDAKREDESCPVTLSFENFINNFVFESWKPKPVKTEMAWLQ